MEIAGHVQGVTDLRGMGRSDDCSKNTAVVVQEVLLIMFPCHSLKTTLSGCSQSNSTGSFNHVCIPVKLCSILSNFTAVAIMVHRVI